MAREVAAAAAIDGMIASLEALARVPTTVAPKLVPVVRRDVLEHVRRGESPEGRPWPATADGHLPLQNTSEDLDVRADDSRVVATLVGVHARHHTGQVRGGKARRILPKAGTVPQSMSVGISAVLEAERRRALEGR